MSMENHATGISQLGCRVSWDLMGQVWHVEETVTIFIEHLWCLWWNLTDLSLSTQLHRHITPRVSNANDEDALASEPWGLPVVMGVQHLPLEVSQTRECRLMFFCVVTRADQHCIKCLQAFFSTLVIQHCPVVGNDTKQNIFLRFYLTAVYCATNANGENRRKHLNVQFIMMWPYVEGR